MKSTVLLTALVASAVASPTWLIPKPKLPATLPVPLDILAKLRGRYIGTATDIWIQEDDAEYAKITKSKEFSQVTPENTMKWETVEPQNGVFDFTEADKLVKWAKKNKKDVRGHTLVWHSQLPGWVNNGNFTSAELKEITKRHVKTVAGHFKGQIKWWDVVNEVFNEDGTYRDSIFYRHFGEDFIEWSFRWAHEADPKASLWINDYNFEGESPLKTEAVTNLVRKLKKKGVPIHGIGAQAHIIQGNVQRSQRDIWKVWSDELKVQVALTELDIRMQLPVTEEKLQEQAADYTAMVEDCLAVKRCIGITLWQWTDKYTWVPGVFSGEGAPLPWDEEFKKKPAYGAIQKTLLGLN